MSNHNEIKKRLDEIEKTYSINITNMFEVPKNNFHWLITQLRASLEWEEKLENMWAKEVSARLVPKIKKMIVTGTKIAYVGESELDTKNEIILALQKERDDLKIYSEDLKEQRDTWKKTAYIDAERADKAEKDLFAASADLRKREADLNRQINLRKQDIENLQQSQAERDEYRWALETLLSSFNKMSKVQHEKLGRGLADACRNWEEFPEMLTMDFEPLMAVLAKYPRGEK